MDNVQGAAGFPGQLRGEGDGVGAAATGEATSRTAVATESRLAAKPFEEINIIPRLRAERFRAELPRRRRARGCAILVAT